jgi:hypothetical protein
MITRLPAVAALLCLSAVSLSTAGCAATTAGTASPAASGPPATAESLPALLLPAADVAAALAGSELVVTKEATAPWNDSAHVDDVDCLAVAGAAQQSAYAGAGWTAIRGQVLREPPPAPAWRHFAVQAVVLFGTAEAAADFYARSRQSWQRCSEREMSYAQPLAPDQLWSIGPAETDRDVLSVSRTQRGPQQWSCQRALTVRNNVAVDIEACSLDGPTAAAAGIARAISDRLPSA